MEGPSVKALSIKLSYFVGEEIKEVKGNARIKFEEIINKKINEIFSIGKNLFFKIDNKYLRIHFMMYGSIRINSFKNLKERLSLITNKGFLNFYNCYIKILDIKDFKKNFEEEVDIVSEKWNLVKVLNLIQKFKDEYYVMYYLIKKYLQGWET